MNKPSTKMITHLRYEDLFNSVEKGNLILPLSYLDDEKNIDTLINDIIQNFDPVEATSYSSFLNMLCQSVGSGELLEINKKELLLTGLTKKIPDNKLLFHRDNLLYFVAQIIEQNVDGDMHITGECNSQNSQKYYKALLLINSKINKEADGDKDYAVMKMLIREYPYYYDPQLIDEICLKRICRYKYIYNELLNSLPPKDEKRIYEGIKAIEQEMGISLKDYFYVLEGLFNWFVHMPVAKNTAPNQKIRNSSLGFNYNNLNSFYIDKAKFRNDEKFLKLIEGLSKGLPALRSYFKGKERKDKIDNYYKCFQNFFDYPIFKLNGKQFCIIDLKFLIEGICSGFLWKIPAERKDIEDAYGLLMEEYFEFLLKKIFQSINITRAENNRPDAIIEHQGYLIIFEFTTEYYRIASLYNTDTSSFKEDLHRLLFNIGKNDPMARGKKQKGKFIKLNDYIEQEKNKNKKIIPILVTENALGDFDLLNKFDNFLEDKIKSNALMNLQYNKPFIINLDDLEIFWAMSVENAAETDFIDCIESWEKAKAEKGPFHYNFSYFIANKKNGVVRNTKYREFFGFTND
ncbi:MAG: hypothetical protein WC855_08525 [Thermodesulfovibrionales bacterium]